MGSKRDVESKIIEVIKKSPIGVTSSEIAKLVGLNRITITKYLAIIKEKALIDFRQFGMAKLWYIPVNLNKEEFLRDTIVNIYSNINKKDLRSVINKAADEISNIILVKYQMFHNTETFSFNQIADSINDAQNKMGGNFSVVSKDEKKLIFKNTRSAFRDHIVKCPYLIKIIEAVIGKIAANGTDGYAKVVIVKSIAKGDEEDIFEVYFKKNKLSGIEYSKPRVTTF